MVLEISCKIYWIMVSFWWKSPSWLAYILYTYFLNLWPSYHEHRSSEARYKTKFEINWPQILSLLQFSKINLAEGLKTGFVNFNSHDEIKGWKKISGQVDNHIFQLEPLHKGIQWSDLYPEWIDEDRKFEVPNCPLFPMPNVRNELKLKLVVVKVPCNDHLDSARDIIRLQVQLAAAHVASSTRATHVLLLDSCQPLPNLFTCDSLVMKQENAWLFEVDHAKIRKRLTLPIGSCELAVTMTESMTCKYLCIHNILVTRGFRYFPMLKERAYLCPSFAWTFLTISLWRRGWI